MKRIFVVASLFALAACGKKEEPASSGGTASTDNAAAGANVPADANSKAFAAELIKNPVHNFAPSDNSGARFVYVTLSFAKDNTWTALARLGEGDESVDCKETGTWTMDPASSATSATMEWKLTDTTCPGRPKNNIMRASVSMEGGDYKISFR